MAAKKKPAKAETPDIEEKEEPAKPETPDIDGSTTTVTLTERCAVSPDGFTVWKFKKGRQEIENHKVALIRKHYPDIISAK